jgi:hypothetical protein
MKGGGSHVPYTGCTNAPHRMDAQERPGWASPTPAETCGPGPIGA